MRGGTGRKAEQEIFFAFPLRLGVLALSEPINEPY